MLFKFVCDGCDRSEESQDPKPPSWFLSVGIHIQVDIPLDRVPASPPLMNYHFCPECVGNLQAKCDPNNWPKPTDPTVVTIRDKGFEHIQEDGPWNPDLERRYQAQALGATINKGKGY